MLEFTPFPKLPRLSRDIIVTEKLDGTNASVFIDTIEGQPLAEGPALCCIGDLLICAGSRTRWLSRTADNFGFANWVYDHAEELSELGPGHHFGEWWGRGIQRGYGLDEKRFSLFNTSRWADPATRPGCVSVVPVLYQGHMLEGEINGCLDDLETEGSFAAPGFREPEGICIFHTAANVIFKKTVKGDEKGKSM